MKLYIRRKTESNIYQQLLYSQNKGTISFSMCCISVSFLPGSIFSLEKDILTPLCINATKFIRYLVKPFLPYYYVRQGCTENAPAGPGRFVPIPQ